MKTNICCLIFLASIIPFGHANAAIIVTDSGDEVIGINHIAIAGDFYDVEFSVELGTDFYHDGTSFAPLFDTQTDSLAASIVLNALFRDGGELADTTFDFSPFIVAGCESTGQCDMFTAYKIQASTMANPVNEWQIFTTRAFNINDIAHTRDDPVDTSNYLIRNDRWKIWTQPIQREGVWARWSVSSVPEPTTFSLVSIALISVFAARKRRGNFCSE